MKREKLFVYGALKDPMIQKDIFSCEIVIVANLEPRTLMGPENKGGMMADLYFCAQI